MINILFTHYGDDPIRGSERCLLDLLKHLDRDTFRPVAWCNGEPMAREARKLGVKTYRSDFPVLFGGRDCRFDFQRFAAIVGQGRKIVRDEGIDLLHANSGAPNQWLNLVARAHRLPLVSHLHSRYPLRDRLTLGLHHTSQVVGVSQPIIDQLIEDGIDRERVTVIPNGIDTGYQDAAEPRDLRQLLGLEPQDFIAFGAASLIPRKGVDLLILAIEQLRRMRLPVHLVIAGDGPEREPLASLARHLGLEHCVHFLGARDDVASLLRGGVDVFVTGAREEVFGLALAEANLAEVPVVAPRVGGIPGVVEDGVTGLLVPPESSTSIARAMARLYSSPRLRTGLGQAGRRRVLERFRIETNVERFEAIYRDLHHDRGRHLGLFSNASLGSLWRMSMRAARVGLRRQPAGPGTIVARAPTGVSGS